MGQSCLFHKKWRVQGAWHPSSKHLLDWANLYQHAPCPNPWLQEPEIVWEWQVDIKSGLKASQGRGTTGFHTFGFRFLVKSQNSNCNKYFPPPQSTSDKQWPLSKFFENWYWKWFLGQEAEHGKMDTKCRNLLIIIKSTPNKGNYFLPSNLAALSEAR